VKNRSGAILTVAFGTLGVLIVLFGFSISRRARQLNEQMRELQDSYQQREAALNEIRSNVYLASILSRDLVLDTSRLGIAAQRQQLLELLRTSRRTMIEQLERESGADRAAVDHLRKELEIFWESLDTVLTPTRQVPFPLNFLRREVVPRRQAAIALVREIADLNAAEYLAQKAAIQRREQEFHRDLREVTAFTLGLGILVAAASVARVFTLERRAARERARIEAAERELRRLSQQLVRAQEEERKALSRELHDEVGQMLTGLRMELGNLERLQHAGSPEFPEHLAETKQLAERALRTVRDISLGLRPSMLDDLGLEPALQWQAREFSRHTGIPVDVQMDGSLDALPESHRTCLYRVVQEALTNCARHARARNIRVAVHGAGSYVTLTVQDDGVGLAGRTGGGLGLIGMEERVRELSGTLQMHSQPQRGTLLKIELPLAREKVV
jgi:signal transduction histidine kinase